MKKVFFTDRKKISDFEKVIKILPKNSAIIIREYDLGKKLREEFAKKISVLARRQGLKVLVGKDFSLAKKIKADGVHFSDLEKLPLSFLRKNSFPKNFIFSLSCHSQKSALKAVKSKPNWVFISPIFPTTSHKNVPTIGIKNLAKIYAQNKKLSGSKPAIYALGGVNSKNIKSLQKLGISGFGAIDFFLKNS